MTADTGDMFVRASESTASAGGAAPQGLAAAADKGPSDEALIRRLRAGETAAGETLVRRYHQPLLRYLQRLAGNDHLAEEIHQATWLSVLEHLEKFDAAASGGGFKAWLFRIATN